MESLSPVSPAIVLPPRTPSFHLRHRRFALHPLSSTCQHVRLSSCRRRRIRSLLQVSCKSSGGNDGGSGSGSGSGRFSKEDDDGRGNEEVERALSMDGSIPGTSNEFLKRVSSRAYDMRRHLHESFDSSSYDVLDSNPWRDTSKPVYVLTHHENQLCTMKTRRNRSEVERELGLLFSRGDKWGSSTGKQSTQARSGTKFQMLVEDVRDGVLVFEDENEAVRYCDLLQGGGKGCEGVAEIEASSVFDLCSKMKALAVLFRRGGMHPLPQSLELNLRARKRSLED